MTDPETKRLLTEIRDLLGDIALSIYESYGSEFNYGSPVECSEALQRIVAKDRRRRWRGIIRYETPRIRAALRNIVASEERYNFDLRITWNRQIGRSYDIYGVEIDREWIQGKLAEYPETPEKWVDRDGMLLWRNEDLESALIGLGRLEEIPDQHALLRKGAV